MRAPILVERAAREVQDMVRPTFKDLPLVMLGAYPPDGYAAVLGAAATPTEITTCPAGVWRVVLFAVGYPELATTAGAFVTLRVRRNGVKYTLGCTVQARTDAAYAYGQCANLYRPVTLRPGDTLIAEDENAKAGLKVDGYAAWVDVDIPSGGEVDFYRTRRA